MKSSLPFTSVVSYHTNEFGCGVAKFSKLLAERLGVPLVPLEGGYLGNFPLLSLKASECERECEILADEPWDFSFGLFWHDKGEPMLTGRADVVYYADPSLGSPGLWCPSLLTPSRPRIVRLFSFGMAHKIHTAHHVKVKTLLDAAGLDYRLRVSVGLHEGTDLGAATASFDALKAIHGDRMTILGILSDDAVAEELQHADYVLAFFDQGVRLNNTTVHAALNQRRPVVTNHDDQTPQIMREITMNVDSPIWVDWLCGKAHVYSWKHLIHQMESIYAATLNRQP